MWEVKNFLYNHFLLYSPAFYRVFKPVIYQLKYTIATCLTVPAPAGIFFVRRLIWLKGMNHISSSITHNQHAIDLIDLLDNLPRDHLVLVKHLQDIHSRLQARRFPQLDMIDTPESGLVPA